MSARTTPPSAQRPPARLVGRRTLFHVGDVAVPTYSVALYVGTVLGVWAGMAAASARGLDQDEFVLTIVLLLVPAMAGARGLYVARHWNEYRRAPARIFARGEGGAALFGGLVVAVPVSVAVARLTGVAFWKFWDAAALTMLIGLAVTRFGCLANGCCGGRPTTSRIAMCSPDVHGHWERRVPTQLLESAWALLLAVVTLVATRSVSHDGWIFLGVVAAYSVPRAWLQTLRASAPSRQSDPGCDSATL